MSLTMNSSFWDKTFITASTDSGRAGSSLLNLLDILNLVGILIPQSVARKTLPPSHLYSPLPLPEPPPGAVIFWGRQGCLGLLEQDVQFLDFPSAGLQLLLLGLYLGLERGDQ
jgi:hypothetical protein